MKRATAQMALEALKITTTPMPEDRQLVLRAIAALEADLAQPVEPVAQPIIMALRFYANGAHYNLDDDEEFDTVSGEPQNWLCSGRDESSTMVEDGTIARCALRGQPIGWADGDEDEAVKPIKGEAPYTAPPAEAINAEMLGALQDVVARFEAKKDRYVFSQRLALTKARAVIAKATGSAT